MIVVIIDILRNLACSNNDQDEEDGEDEDDEDAELGKLSDDDEPGWMMSIIFQTVYQCMERVWPKLMKFDKMTPPGRADIADRFPERERKLGTNEPMVMAVAQLQMDNVAVLPVPTTCGERKEYPHTIPGRLQMMQGTSRPRCSDTRLGSGMQQYNKGIACHAPNAEPE